MSTSMLDVPVDMPTTSPSQRLRTTTAAVRLTIRWFGVRKTLTREQKDQAAGTFGAEGGFLSAGKKLLDTRHEAFKAVTGARNRAVSYWRSLTLPFTETGIRLIRQDRIEPFDDQMHTFRDELNEAVSNLDNYYADMRSAASVRLGRLYRAADYPESLTGLFALDWDFPSVEPPDYLRQLNPELYRAECERVAARFDEAVRLAEGAFTAELSDLVTHLAERLAGTADGKPKIFRDSAITNFKEFFDRFQQLNVRSNDQLDELVERAHHIVEGRDPQQLRENGVLRQTVAQELSDVKTVLDDLLVDRPRRNILRRPR